MEIDKYRATSGRFSFRYDFTYRGQRLRRSGFASYDEAERHALQSKLEVLGESPEPARVEHHVLGALHHEACVRRWDDAKDGEKSSKQAREFVELIGDLTSIPKAATAPNLLRFRDYLLFERDLGNATCNRYIAAVKGMFDVAVEQGWLESSPSIKKLKETPVERKVVSQRVREQIMSDTAGECDAPEVAQFLLEHGLRLSELDKLDFSVEGQVTVRDTKNGDSRTLPTKWAGLWTCPEHKLREYLAQFDLTPHDLRHTFITDLIEAGNPLPVVQKLAGHRSIGTTMRYFHLTDGGAKAAMERKEKHVNG